MLDEPTCSKPGLCELKVVFLGYSYMHTNNLQQLTSSMGLCKALYLSGKGATLNGHDSNLVLKKD